MTKREAQRLLWLILRANDGFDLEADDLEGYPGDHRVSFTIIHNLDKSLRITANEIISELPSS